MARNQHAVVWTWLSGTPEKMGHLVLSAELASFTYTKDYISSGRPGFCLLGDGSIWGTDTVTYPISERIPVFPRLLTLVPGNNPRNLQRRHYLDLLRTKLGKEPPPGLETEWQLLLMGGHGGIGHVDVFSDDIAAETWYSSCTDSRDPVAMSQTTNPQGSGKWQESSGMIYPHGRSQLWRYGFRTSKGF